MESFRKAKHKTKRKGADDPRPEWRFLSTKEPMRGIEPPTAALQKRCSAIELHRLTRGIILSRGLGCQAVWDLGVRFLFCTDSRRMVGAAFMTPVSSFADWRHKCRPYHVS